MKKKSYRDRLDQVAVMFNAKGVGENYCACGVRAELFDKLLNDGDQGVNQYEIPKVCDLEVCNPYPEDWFLRKTPAERDAIHKSIIAKMFPEGIPKDCGGPERMTGHVAEENWRKEEAEESLNWIPEPEPEPESSGNPLQDAITAKLLNRSELAAALLVPKENQDQ